MQNAKPILSVVIPCLNEADSIPFVIPPLIDILKKWLGPNVESFEIIVVDDCSSDNSRELLNGYPEVRVMDNSERLGYGGALKRGFGACRGSYITFFDLDRTYDPVDLEMLFRTLKDEDLAIVFGNRMAQQNEMPKIRRLGNAIFAKIIRTLYRVKIDDVCTGMRVFKSELLPVIVSLPENELNFTLAFTLKILNVKKSFSQVSIKYHERIGRSKLSVVFDGWIFLLTIVRYYAQRSR